MTKANITIVVPCFNEEKNIERLLEKLNDATSSVTDVNFTYLLVDDGSADGTFNVIRNAAKTQPKIRAIKLSRNFGSHVAISAGIENAAGSDAAIVISADLQEPPELIGELISKWRNGSEVVWTIREKRAQSFIGKSLSKSFYKLFIKASGLKNYPKEGPSAFFLLDQKVCLQWRKFKETNRMIIGMVAWMGFKHSCIYYQQNERNSGKSSFTFMKLIKLAIDSFVSFSFAPIRFISYLGVIVSLIGFIYSLVLIFNKLFLGIGPTGWTSIMVVVLFLGGIQLITLGIIGEYVWRGVEESRSRPLYIIAEEINGQER
ncbi:MAG: glycosyltransferase family 2 protein [Bacteroidota bacterium]